MESFPYLLQRQVALLRAETNTGIVLDENCVRAGNDDQKAYTVFSNELEALNYAKVLMQSRLDIEVCIYDRNKSVLHFLNPYLLKNP